MTRLAPVFLIGVCLSVSAGELQQVNVHYHSGVYQLDLDAIINARQDAVFTLVSDYDHLDRISRVLSESALLSSSGTGLKQRRLVAKTCVWFFCFTAIMVEDVKEIGKHTIITTMVPEESDFKSGRTEVTVTAIGKRRSRIHVYLEEEPGFWIPPLIGPILMKHKLLKEALDTIKQIEILTHDV